MDKQQLKEYIDICELIKATESDLEYLRKRTKQTVKDRVVGSNPEFPYEKRNFNLEGEITSMEDQWTIENEEKILQERKAAAERMKAEVEAFINTLTPRLQRIVRIKYIEGQSWAAVARTLGRNATVDSVRMELDRFLKKK